MNDPGAQRPGDPVPLAQRYTSADPIDWCGAAVYPMYAEALSLGTTTVRLHALSVMAPAEVTGLGVGLTVQGGYVHLNGKSLQGVDIWYDALADGVDIVVTADAPDALFTLTPVWVAGTQAQQSWTGNYGMVIDLLPGSTSTLWCSTGPGTPDFNELVVELATAHAPDLAPFAPPSVWTEDAAIQEAVPHTPFAPVTMPPTPAISAAMLADPLLSAALRAVGPDSGRPATSTGSRSAPSGFLPPAVQNPSAPLSAADRVDAPTADPADALPGGRSPAGGHGDTTPAGPTGAIRGARPSAPDPDDVAPTDRGAVYPSDPGPFADRTGTAAFTGGPVPAGSQVGAVPTGSASAATGHGFAPIAADATGGGATDFVPGTRGPDEEQVRAAASDGLSGAVAQVPGGGRRDFANPWTAPNAGTVGEVTVDRHDPHVSTADLPALPTRVPVSAAADGAVASGASVGGPADSPVPVMPTDAAVRTAGQPPTARAGAAAQTSNPAQLPTRRGTSAGHAPVDGQAPDPRPAPTGARLPTRQSSSAERVSIDAQASNAGQLPSSQAPSTGHAPVDRQAPDAHQAPTAGPLPTRQASSAEQVSAGGEAAAAGQPAAAGHDPAVRQAAAIGEFGDRTSATKNSGARFVSPDFRAPLSDTTASATDYAAASDSSSSAPPQAVVAASADGHGGTQSRQGLVEPDSQGRLFGGATDAGTQSGPANGGMPETPVAPSVLPAVEKPHPVSSAAAAPERPAPATTAPLDMRTPGQGAIAPGLPAIPPDSPAEANAPASALRAPQASGGQGFGRALYDLGTAMHERGEHDSARTLLTQAAEAGHSAAAYDLGVLLLRAGDRAGAEHWWKAAAHDDPRAAASLTELPR
ncbi:hypothetical protein ACIA5E_03690 [Nocardia asteroides]|uniref:hypothetical protein n=1 Tax=Nocardia asteroides TaxID=1824 RepID=UPI00379B62DE